jgi:GMP synthase (glutamine-hydrolysing)
MTTPDPLHAQRILVLDFGSQYTMLIARRIRELHVYCEIWPCTRSLEDIRAFAPRGIVLSGGPASVYDPGAPIAPAVWDLGVPVLGICYGMQAMALQLGGRVAPGTTREYGRASIEILRKDGLFADLASHEREAVWMSHGDCVAVMPEGFEALARSDDGILAAMADESKRLYGLQFHPEVHHTPGGTALLRRFVLDLCGCEGSWTMAGFIDSAVQAIRATVGQGRILCALSGGVDSSVTATLLHRAIGDRLTCVFVDNGLLRTGEGVEVQRIFADGFHIPLVIADAAAEFLGALAGVTERGGVYGLGAAWRGFRTGWRRARRGRLWWGRWAMVVWMSYGHVRSSGQAHAINGDAGWPNHLQP